MATSDIAAAGLRLRTLRQELKSTVVDLAWDQDWAPVRLAVAAHGKSIFRVFISAYRKAIASLRGVCCGELPKSFEERLVRIDGLVEGQELAAKIRAAEPKIAPLLGAMWQAEETDWSRIAAAADWVAAARALEPGLVIRRREVLIARVRAAHLAEQLSDLLAETFDSYAALQNELAFDESQAFDGRKLHELSSADLKWIATRWHERFGAIVQWPPIRDDMEWLREMECGVLADRIYTGMVSASQVASVLELAAYEQLWKTVVGKRSDIDRTTGDELTRLVDRFKVADRERITIAADEVVSAHVRQFPTGTAGAVGVLKEETKKSRRLRPVRKLIVDAGEAIQRFKPVFLMSPLSVAQFLKPGVLMFDMLVIDEASQVRPEDALGAIARCKQLVVVGDSRQLPPTNFFSRLVNDDEPSDEEDENADGAAAIADIESILDMCHTFPERMLRWHYRSEHPALIATSNRSFYNNALMLPPSVVARVNDGMSGLMFHAVPSGGYDRGGSARNEIEAEAVAQAVLQHARTNPDLTLGVGTFSVAQRDAIRGRIDTLAAAERELEGFMQRHPSDSAFFVKNLENIQGDERDVILISVGYGKDRDGRLTQNFGPVGRNGGERRLNVLITRARKRCAVFSSIVAEDIRIEGTGKPGVVALREFLKLAKDGYSDVSAPSTRSFDSDFEEAVAHALAELGYAYHPQVGMAGFFIDIGVIDPRDSNRYLLGIECDGATYHSSRYARDRDRLRQQILENRGWQIHRIWSTDWFYRREDQIKRLKAVLDAARLRPQQPTAPTKAAAPAVAGLRSRAADASARPEVPTASSSRTKAEDNMARLAPYVEAVFDIRERGKLDPHELQLERAAEIVERILGIEQPIHGEEVARRIASLFGLQRAGSRIQEVADKSLAKLKRSGLAASDQQFWSLMHSTVLARDRSRLSPSSTLRKPENIAPVEIVAAARHVLEQNLALVEDELVTEIARAFGFARTGHELTSIIQKAVRGRLQSQLETDHMGRLRLKPT